MGWYVCESPLSKIITKSPFCVISDSFPSPCFSWMKLFGLFLSHSSVMTKSNLSQYPCPSLAGDSPGSVHLHASRGSGSCACSSEVLVQSAV